MSCTKLIILFFFFNDTATTEIYTLSLHDALPIYERADPVHAQLGAKRAGGGHADRKSTRLNSSHQKTSYAVFCLKKKKNIHIVLVALRDPEQMVRGARSEEHT